MNTLKDILGRILRALPAIFEVMGDCFALLFLLVCSMIPFVLMILAIVWLVKELV